MPLPLKAAKATGLAEQSEMFVSAGNKPISLKIKKKSCELSIR